MNPAPSSSVPEPEIPTSIPLTEYEANLHSRASNAARAYERSEAELMEALIAVDGAKVYLRLGYPSLFKYATTALQLSEAVAYAAISVARKASVIPELRVAIGSGEIGFSKAKKILSVLDSRAASTAHADWVEKAASLSSRKLERAVASENPSVSVSEKVAYRSARRIELTLGIWEELMLDFRHAQNLVANGRGGAVGLERTLAEVLRFYLERKDPERRAKRAIAKKGMSARVDSPVVEKEMVRSSKDAFEGAAVVGQQFTGTVPVTRIEERSDRKKTDAGRRPLPAILVHQVRIRDQNRCQATLPGGEKCGARRWLDLHHRIPLSAGGGDSLENLTTLCRAHHQAHHVNEARIKKAQNGQQREKVAPP